MKTLSPLSIFNFQFSVMLEEYLNQFLQHLRYERNVSTHTLRNYSSDLLQFREYLLPKAEPKTFRFQRY
jgi:site-specific recombinase XerD